MKETFISIMKYIVSSMFWRGWHKPSDKRLEEELHAVREELRTIRELLERLLNQQMPNQQMPTSTLSSSSPTERHTPSQGSKDTHLLEQLTKLLRARHLQLNRYQQVQSSSPLETEIYHLGLFMSQHYPVIAPFLAELRATLSRPRPIYFSLPPNIPVDQLSILTNVGTRLYRLRFLHRYTYDRARSQIVACADAQPDSRNYLSGGWFEMGVFQAVRRKLGQAPALLLRDVHLLCDGGGSCELDILIYLYNGDHRLILLECKSGVGGLKPEEIPQVRRAVNLLNLGIQRAAVVLPETPITDLVDWWVQQTGASIIGFPQLDAFLQQAIA